MLNTTELRQELEARVDELNKILHNKKEYGEKYEQAFNGAKDEVVTTLQQVNDSKMCDYFKIWIESKKPVENFLLNSRIKDEIRLKTKKDKDTNVVVAYELDTGVTIYDIRDYVVYGHSINKDLCQLGWNMQISKLSLLLHLRIMQDTGATANLKKFRNDYTLNKYFSDIKDDINKDKTPLSNTQLVKAAQAAVDKIIFVENPKKKGVNLVKITNYDINYIMHSMSKNVDQGKLSVLSNKLLRRFICDAIRRILLKAEYSVFTGDIDNLEED